MQYKHLRTHDREVIQKMNDQGASLQRIADKVGVHKSTVSRELRRLGKENYFAAVANQVAAHSRAGANQLRTKKHHRPLFVEIMCRFKKKHSPEQISGRLKLDYPDDPKMRISHESIYKLLYETARNEGIDLRAHFRRKKRNYRTRRSSRKKHIEALQKKSIHNRPPEIAADPCIGHWETDLIEGRRNTGFLATFVDKKSKYTLAGKLDRKTSEEFNTVTRDTFACLDEVGSLTHDNGSEMSDFATLEEILQCPIYFADPGKPQQRGLNENTNGLLRQYFKKSSDFSGVTQKEVDRALRELNDRPRKCLDFLSPAEVFLGNMSKQSLLHFGIESTKWKKFLVSEGT